MSQGVTARETVNSRLDDQIFFSSSHTYCRIPISKSLAPDHDEGGGETVLTWSHLKVIGVSDAQILLMRLLDLIGAIAGLVVLCPILAVVALVVRLDSKGPAIYKQRRVGERAKIFTLYKFRTMVVHAETNWGFKPAGEDDERVTRVGKVLRKTRLDELPQLFNVIRGDMSLVGPRPENLYRVNLHQALRGPRLAVKPGITGLAQIRSLYDLKPDHKIKYDYLYIQKRSVMLNLYILMMTIPVVIKKTGW